MAQVVKAPDGRRLSVEGLGDPKGKPVFLLYGTPGSRDDPHPRGILLSLRAIRLITYDRPSYPVSGRLPGGSVADAEGIADHFAIDRFSAVGRSGDTPYSLAYTAIMMQSPRSPRPLERKSAHCIGQGKMARDAIPREKTQLEILSCGSLFRSSDLFLTPRSRHIESLFAECGPCSG